MPNGQCVALDSKFMTYLALDGQTAEVEGDWLGIGDNAHGTAIASSPGLAVGDSVEVYISLNPTQPASPVVGLPNTTLTDAIQLVEITPGARWCKFKKVGAVGPATVLINLYKNGG